METIPAYYYDQIPQGGGMQSYCTIYPDKWLTLLNRRFNPLRRQIELYDLDLLTRNRKTGRIYAPSGWYAGDPEWGNE